MIISFLKNPVEVNAKCYIEKFLDRIWLDKDGSAVVLRTLILRVGPDSPQSVSGLHMLSDGRFSPTEISDISQTGLDSNFYWNQRESEPLKIADHEKGVIVYDGLSNVHIPKRNTIRTIPFGKFFLLEIAFNQAYYKDEGIFLRLKMKIPRFAEIQPNGDLAFDLKYESLEGARNVLNQLDFTRREIEVLSLVDEEAKFGGFDVFLTPPQGFQIVTEVYSPSMLGRTSKNADGNDIMPRFNKYWRLRFITGGKTFKKADTGMTISGKVIKDYLEERLTQLSRSEKRRHLLNITWHIISILIGLFALVIALFSLFRK